MQKSNLQIYNPENDALIEDLKEAQIDVKGNLDAWKNKNPSKGHALDEFRYFLWANFNEIASEIEL